MNRYAAIVLLLLLTGALRARDSAPPARVRVAQIMAPSVRFRNYPDALPSLLRELAARSTVPVDPEPAVLPSFAEPGLFNYPFAYVNFADREDWAFSSAEQANIRDYLERGGFIFVDAGISAEFLRGDASYGQHHSFAEWRAHPDLQAAFAAIWPEKQFAPLPRRHPLFRSLYQGLPEAAELPDTVRDFVVEEKWPEGTYSAVGLEVKGRLAVLAMPIIAMGWGRDQLGNWRTTIGFRIRESAPGLDDVLQTAAYSGRRFEVAREDGAVDVVYCQADAMPAWVREPEGRWRVFRYYHSSEISDFAHRFYTRLGLNILVYALTH